MKVNRIKSLEITVFEVFTIYKDQLQLIDPFLSLSLQLIRENFKIMASVECLRQSQDMVKDGKAFIGESIEVKTGLHCDVWETVSVNALHVEEYLHLCVGFQYNLLPFCCPRWSN